MKEQILNVFQELGFLMTDLEELGYGFHYEGNNYLYMPNDKDEDFLSISIPAMLEVTDENIDTVYRVMDKVNAKIKYVKANKMGDNVWLFYERELMGGDDLETTISQMIRHLDSSANFFNGVLKQLTDDVNEDEVNDDNEENEESNDDNE